MHLTRNDYYWLRDSHARHNSRMSLEEAVDQIESGFGFLDNITGAAPGRDGLIGLRDLQTARSHPHAHPALREACDVFIRTPGAFGILENAAGLAQPDALAGMADIAAFREGLRSTSAVPAEPTSTPSAPTSTPSAREQVSDSRRGREPASRRAGTGDRAVDRTRPATLRSDGSVGFNVGGQTIDNDGTVRFGADKRVSIHSDGKVDFEVTPGIRIGNDGTVTFS